MVLWIVLGSVVIGLIYLVLAARALRRRVAVLQAEQGGLAATAARAQELAQVAQGLQAHADSLRIRTELTQELVGMIKAHARTSSGPGV